MSMKEYLQEAQMELFIFAIMTEFMTTEGYNISKEQQQGVIRKNLDMLKALGYDKTVKTDSEDKEDLKESIQRLAMFAMQLFSVCIMQSAREEKYKEIISSLKDKNL